MKSKKSLLKNISLAMFSTLAFLSGCVNSFNADYYVDISKETYKKMNPITRVVFEVHTNPSPCDVSVDYDNDGVFDETKFVYYQDFFVHNYPKGQHTAVFKCNNKIEKINFEIKPYNLEESLDLFKDYIRSYGLSAEGSGVLDYTFDGSNVEIPYLTKFDDSLKSITPKGKGIVLDESQIKNKGLEDIVNSDDFPYNTFYLKDGMWQYEVNNEFSKYVK